MTVSVCTPPASRTSADDYTVLRAVLSREFENIRGPNMAHICTQKYMVCDIEHAVYGI